MKRTYITAISLQGRGGLEKGMYQPDGFKLAKNVETSFPIVPIIASTMGRKEDVEIIVLRTENSDVKDNYEAFLKDSMEGRGERAIGPAAPGLVTQDESFKLIQPFTLEEIKSAVFEMNPDKAPGPDGFSMVFYQKYWDLVQTDLMSLLSDFYN